MSVHYRFSGCDVLKRRPAPGASSQIEQKSGYRVFRRHPLSAGELFFWSVAVLGGGYARAAQQISGGGSCGECKVATKLDPQQLAERLHNYFEMRSQAASHSIDNARADIGGW